MRTTGVGGRMGSGIAPVDQSRKSLEEGGEKVMGAEFEQWGLGSVGLAYTLCVLCVFVVIVLSWLVSCPWCTFSA